MGNAHTLDDSRLRGADIHETEYLPPNFSASWIASPGVPTAVGPTMAISWMGGSTDGSTGYGMFDHFQPHQLPAPVHFDRDYVDAPGGVAKSMFKQIGFGYLRQLVLFAAGNGLFR
jgi:hypothetical protein